MNSRDNFLAEGRGTGYLSIYKYVCENIHVDIQVREKSVLSQLPTLCSPALQPSNLDTPAIGMVLHCCGNLNIR